MEKKQKKLSDKLTDSEKSRLKEKITEKEDKIANRALIKK